MTKSGSYVSNQAMKRLLLEPAGALPQGRIYMRNFGERLPYRGGHWYHGAYAGLAALVLDSSRAYTFRALGFARLCLEPALGFVGATVVARLIG